eukprot:m.615502 g.615502  ORF g.615502 m.615502 type:complete len:577 (-) comp22506_c0_seq1:1767-3497(-)
MHLLLQRELAGVGLGQCRVCLANLGVFLENGLVRLALRNVRLQPCHRRGMGGVEGGGGGGVVVQRRAVHALDLRSLVLEALLVLVGIRAHRRQRCRQSLHLLGRAAKCDVQFFNARLGLNLARHNAVGHVLVLRLQTQHLAHEHQRRCCIRPPPPACMHAVPSHSHLRNRTHTHTLSPTHTHSAMTWQRRQLSSTWHPDLRTQAPVVFLQACQRILGLCLGRLHLKVLELVLVQPLVRHLETHGRADEHPRARLVAEPPRQGNSEVLQDLFELERQQILLDNLQQPDGDMEQHVESFAEQHVQHVVHREQRELGRKQRQEPLRCVHMGLHANVFEVRVQVGQHLVNKTVELEKLELQIGKPRLEHLADVVIKHELDEHDKRLFLGHVQQQHRGNEAKALAIADFLVVHGICLADAVQPLLSLPALLLEELVAGECAREIPRNLLMHGAAGILLSVLRRQLRKRFNEVVVGVPRSHQPFPDLMTQHVGNPLACHGADAGRGHAVPAHQQVAPLFNGVLCDLPVDATHPRQHVVAAVDTEVVLSDPDGAVAAPPLVIAAAPVIPRTVAAAVSVAAAHP